MKQLRIMAPRLDRMSPGKDKRLSQRRRLHVATRSHDEPDRRIGKDRRDFRKEFAL